MIHANKHMTAGCESFLDSFGLNDNMQKFNVAQVIERLDEALHTATDNQEALEHVGGMEALDHFRDMLTLIKTNYRIGETATIGKSFTDIF